MLTVAHALMMRPDLLILDEPTIGLATVILEQLSQALERLRQTTPITVLLGEQNVTFALLRHANRVYVLSAQACPHHLGRRTEPLRHRSRNGISLGLRVSPRRSSGSSSAPPVTLVRADFAWWSTAAGCRYSWRVTSIAQAVRILRGVTEPGLRTQALIATRRRRFICRRLDFEKSSINASVAAAAIRRRAAAAQSASC